MARIAIAGAGYVGLSLACLLARDHDVVVVDVVPEKIDMLNKGVTPIKDADIEYALLSGELHLSATLDGDKAYATAEVVFIAAPTDYDEETGRFDVSHVDEVAAAALSANPRAVIVVKSTVPVGYTDSLAYRYPEAQVMFSPEFLREGNALHDNLHPSRIVVGVPGQNATDAHSVDAAGRIARLLSDAALDSRVEEFLMEAREAESVKLFANTYLACRVAFFNELDSYANACEMSAANIISAVVADPRIGGHYCNPSFGYGGYCLPKDTKQLLASFGDVPQEMISAVVQSNVTRKRYIAERVRLALDSAGGGKVGVYRLVMKSGSDNFRSSAVQDIMRYLVEDGIDVVIFEPRLDAPDFEGIPKIADFDEFKRCSAVIIANRLDGRLADVRDKVFTRDILGFG